MLHCWAIPVCWHSTPSLIMTIWVDSSLTTPHTKSPPPMKTSHTCSSSTTPIHWTGLAHTTSPFTSHWCSEQASLTINMLGHCILYTNFDIFTNCHCWADCFYESNSYVVVIISYQYDTGCHWSWLGSFFPDISLLNSIQLQLAARYG